MTDRPLILALDIASSTGFAFGRLGSNQPTCGSIRFAGKQASHNAIFGGAVRWWGDFVPSGWRPDILVLEAPLPSTWLKGKTNKDTNDLLLGLHGIIRGIAFERRIFDIRLARTADVRQHFIGLAKCPRAEAKRRVVQRCRALGWLPPGEAGRPDDDAADALATWDYQCSLIDPMIGIRRSPLFEKGVRI